MTGKIFPMCQDVVDHDHNSRGSRDIGGDTLGIFLRSFSTAHFRRELIGCFQHFRVDTANRFEYRASVSPNASHHLSGVFAIAAVDVDQVFTLIERLMAELAGLVVVHAAEQNHHFLDLTIGIGI